MDSRQIGMTALALAGGLLAALAYAVQTDELQDALRVKPVYENGAALFRTCAACHRRIGTGVAVGGVPVIAGQHYEVVVKQLLDFRGARRMDLRMNAYLARHNVERLQDLVDMAAFISSLPPQGTDEFGTGKFIAIGRQAYRSACAGCHGTDAEGDGKLRRPRLAGQHYSYLVRQIEMMIGGSRPNVGWDHSTLVRSLSDEQIMGVADHLSRVKPAPGRVP